MSLYRDGYAEATAATVKRLIDAREQYLLAIREAEKAGVTGYVRELSLAEGHYEELMGIGHQAAES